MRRNPINASTPRALKTYQDRRDLRAPRVHQARRTLRRGSHQGQAGLQPVPHDRPGRQIRQGLQVFRARTWEPRRPFSWTSSF